MTAFEREIRNKVETFLSAVFCLLSSFMSFVKIKEAFLYFQVIKSILNTTPKKKLLPF